MKNRKSTFGMVKIFHIELDLEGCDEQSLNSRRYISTLLRKAAIAAQMRVIDVTTKTHQFEPQGVTGYALLAESHISIHTWPEYQKAIVDILTCNSIHVDKCVETIRIALEPAKMVTRKLSNNRNWIR